jgi:hypothetical protein
VGAGVVAARLPGHRRDHARAARRPSRGTPAGARAGLGEGGAPERITLDFDATLVTSHYEKERAAGNFKGGFGFHPLACYLDESGEALAAILRPGNAGANTAADHIAVWRQFGAAIDMLDDALRDCPDELWTAELWPEPAAPGFVWHLAPRGAGEGRPAGEPRLPRRGRALATGHITGAAKSSAL